VHQALRLWQGDAALAGVRDGAALDRLPEVERKQWRQMWADVEALRARAAGK
jgi:hypothetical protein